MIYQKKVKVFLIGDSFTEGSCQDQNKNVASVLTNEFGINTANYGIGGAGPLLSLAAFIEYGINFKPDFVIYLYYEGNDMHDLKMSKETFLINYLDDFNQNLINRTDEVKEFLADYENLAYEVFKKEFETESEVILTSWDTLPRDFSTFDMELSGYEESEKGGFRDSRYGHKKVYRVMMKSADTLTTKNSLNKLID